ncbi:MAG: hypothetical protein AB8G22_27870 [Saprospiraceae bacterium]
MKRKAHISIDGFLEFFPEVELPVTFSEDTHHDFSRNNDPLPQTAIEQYISKIEGDEIDEFTEFIPCIRIGATHDFHAVVYWKAELLSYHYIMATFDKKGDVIDSRVIAGLFTDGDTITRSVATIDEDWLINVVTGQVGVENEENYNAAQSLKFGLELLPDGRVINELK